MTAPSTIAKPRQRSSWRQPVALVGLLSGVLLATLAAAVAWSLWSDRASRLAAAEAENMRFVQLMEAHARRTYQSAEMLLTVADSLLRGPGRAASPPGAPGVVPLASIGPYSLRVRLFDGNGRMIPFAAGHQPFDASARDYMRQLIAIDPSTGPDRLIVVGAPVHTRETDTLVVPIAMRASDTPYGVAVIVTGVSVDSFQSLYDGARPGESGRSGLFRDDGVLLAGDASQRHMIGRDMSTWVMFDMLRTGDRGSYVTTTSHDGITRMYSYARIAGLPLVVGTGLDVDEVLGPWWRMFWLELGFLATAWLLVGSVALWIIALLRQRERESARLRAALQAAENASLAKSDFLAKMSHELRTPLNAILGFSEVIKDALFGPLLTRYRDYAGDIHRSGRHLLTLINDILDISRIEAGALKLNEEPIAVATVIGEVMATLREQSAAARVVVRMEVEPDLPLLRADLRAVRQMLLNLGSNAIKFTPAGGHVCFAARRGSDGLELHVSDTGIGIAPADLAHVTEPFGRGSSQTAADVEGTGLGLPITKSLIEAHDGQLSIVSAPGEGTQVSLAFPRTRLLRAA